MAFKSIFTFIVTYIFLLQSVWAQATVYGSDKQKNLKQQKQQGEFLKNTLEKVVHDYTSNPSAFFAQAKVALLNKFSSTADKKYYETHYEPHIKQVKQFPQMTVNPDHRGVTLHDEAKKYTISDFGVESFKINNTLIDLKVSSLEAYTLQIEKNLRKVSALNFLDFFISDAYALISQLFYAALIGSLAYKVVNRRVDIKEFGEMRRILSLCHKSEKNLENKKKMINEINNASESLLKIAYMDNKDEFFSKVYDVFSSVTYHCEEHRERANEKIDLIGINKHTLQGFEYNLPYTKCLLIRELQDCFKEYPEDEDPESVADGERDRSPEPLVDTNTEATNTEVPMNSAPTMDE